MTYEEQFGAWLNRQHAMDRRAATVALGISALLSQESLRRIQNAAV